MEIQELNEFNFNAKILTNELIILNVYDQHDIFTSLTKEMLLNLKRKHRDKYQIYQIDCMTLLKKIVDQHEIKNVIRTTPQVLLIKNQHVLKILPCFCASNILEQYLSKNLQNSTK